MGVGAQELLANWLHTVRGLFPPGETDFWMALGVVATTFAAVVALVVGLAPELSRRRMLKTEALMQAAQFVVACKVSASSLRALTAVMAQWPLNSFGSAHCDVIDEAVKRGSFRAMSPVDLHRLALLVGQKRALALAAAFATVESISTRVDVFRILLGGSGNSEAIEKGVRQLLADISGAVAAFVEVQTKLQERLSRVLRPDCT